MKTILFLLGLLPAFTGFAQQYSIDWFKISGGGGASTNGQYAVSGTIGQAEAGAAMAGGGYSLTGGFWSLISVVQTAGAPTLAITHSGNSVVISWPSGPGGFTLQQNANLAPTSWTASTYNISTNGAVQSITISRPAGNLFFRLAKP